MLPVLCSVIIKAHFCQLSGFISCLCCNLYTAAAVSPKWAALSSRCYFLFATFCQSGRSFGPVLTHWEYQLANQREEFDDLTNQESSPDAAHIPHCLVLELLHWHWTLKWKVKGFSALVTLCCLMHPRMFLSRHSFRWFSGLFGFVFPYCKLCLSKLSFIN